jgi:hypothetical protein
MRGDTIVAHFDSLVGTDTSSKARIREIVSLGNASSFYQMKNSKGPATEPTVNYVKGRIIDILFETGKVATVTVTDQATGVLIEPAAASTTPKPGATPGNAPTPGRPTVPRPTAVPKQPSRP